MIGFVKGKVIDANRSDVIILTNSGVGYKINVAANCKFLLEQEAEFFIYTSVKETEISLWGFENKNDLMLFEHLISVSGVGTKTAMTIIDSKGFGNVIKAIVSGDHENLKVSGVGPKTAQKIVIELKSKLAKLADSMSVEVQSDIQSNKKVNDYFDDALEALTSLGYREQDVKNAYSKISDSELELVSDSPTLVKLLLKVI